MRPKLSLLALLASTAHAAYQPTQTDIQTALGRAAAAWGVYTEVRVVKLDRLNNCRIGVDPAALSEFGPRSITINTACKWSKAMLRAALEHEYGHMIVGDGEHSQDKHSVMYSKLGRRRHITAQDRANVRRDIAARGIRPTILIGGMD